MEKGISASEAARELGLTSDQVERISQDIERKVRTTEYLKAAPFHIKGGT